MVHPSILACVLASCFALVQTVDAESTGVATHEKAFHYTLRAGETLSDVARLFQVPASDLMAVNRIMDPDRLAVGQRVVVPNAFAREVAALRTERTRRLDGQREVERNAAQLELRYQNLAAGASDDTREVADGIKRLARAFEQGAAPLERRLADLRAERDREERRYASERPMLGSILRPAREWLARHRLKYRVP